MNQKQSTDFNNGTLDGESDTMKENLENPGSLLQAAPFENEEGKKASSVHLFL